MLLATALHETKVIAELTMQRLRRIARHIEAAASRRAVLGKSGHEHEPTGFDRVAHLSDV